MRKLPDISDLLRAEKKFEGLYKKYNKIREEMQDYNKTTLREIELKVIDRYKAAGITPEECDHPVTRYPRYQGLGIDECECCGITQPKKKKHR